jgi:hypothetical protein
MEDAGLRTGRRGLCDVGDCKIKSRYECPRCGVVYCSVACFKSHSDACVSAFRVGEQELLRGVRATEAEKKSMQEILSRMERQNAEYMGEPDEHKFPDMTRGVRDDDDDGLFWNESDSDADSSDGSSEGAPEDAEVEYASSGDGKAGETRERGCTTEYDDIPAGDAESDEEGDDEDKLEQLLEEMSHLDLDYDEALQRLPPALAAEFKKQIADGRITRLIAAWWPWWLKEQRPNDDDDDDNADASEDEGNAACAPRSPEAGDLEIAPAGACARAADAVLYSVLDIVAAYCLALRLVNGDWRASPAEAAKILYAASPALAADARHDDAAEALSAGRQKRAGSSASTWAVAGLDAAAVLQMPGGAPRALLEVRDILAAGWRGGRARRLCKKVGFLLSVAVGAEEDVALRKKLLGIAEDAERWASRERDMEVERELLQTGQM